ncbi:hypothetical protein Hdeb2414_s0014g00421851 [Helianthus debilis subsp. tardiflorus]
MSSRRLIANLLRSPLTHAVRTTTRSHSHRRRCPCERSTRSQQWFFYHCYFLIQEGQFGAMAASDEADRNCFEEWMKNRNKVYKSAEEK